MTDEVQELQAAMEILERAQADWVFLIRELLRFDTWDGQDQIVRAVQQHDRTAVPSCHDSGKTAIAARIGIAFLSSFNPSKVITTAPTFLQVEELLWREVAAGYHAAKIPLGGRLYKHPLLEMGDDWFMIGIKPEETEPERFQGFHSENILVIVDEASGVPELIFESVDALLTSANAKLLLIGNPTRLTGRFAEAIEDPRYAVVHIDGLETPNLRAGRVVRPYLITPKYVQDVIDTYGMDSDYYRVHVRGVKPRADVEQLIPTPWIEQAEGRVFAPALETPVKVVAVDPGGGGRSETALAYREGQVVKEVIGWNEADGMVSLGRGIAFATEKLADALVFDSTGGWGHGIASRAREVLGQDGIQVYDFNASQKAIDSTRFRRRRDEMWWNLRELFRSKNISIPKDPLLKAQLASVKGRLSRFGAFELDLEPKEEAARHGIPSPDRADAVALAFSVNPPRRLDATAQILEEQVDPFHEAFYGPPSWRRPRRRPQSWRWWR